MTEWQGAILLAQLERLEEQTQTRAANAAFLDDKLGAIPGLRNLRTDPWVTRNSVHLYFFRYDQEQFEGVPRERFMEAVRAEGIPLWGGYPHPLYQNPLFTEKHFGRTGCPVACPLYGREIDYTAVHCPQTEQICQDALWIGQTVLLGTPEDMQDIVRAVEKVRECAGELKD
jgi:dTDP-4-amino-4,6-dideoxygalactose transaminase